MPRRTRKQKPTAEEIQKHAEDCSLNTAHAFQQAQEFCLGRVVAMVTSYENPAGAAGRVAFVHFHDDFSNVLRLRYLEEAVRQLKVKMAGDRQEEEQEK